MIAGHDLKSHHLMATPAVPCCRLEHVCCACQCLPGICLPDAAGRTQNLYFFKQALPSP